MFSSVQSMIRNYYYFSFLLLGIPDYRSEEVGLYAKSNHKPVQHQEFVKYPRVRQRYWARNFVGWPRFSRIEPNASHHSIRELEKVKTLKTYELCFLVTLQCFVFTFMY